MVVPPGVVGMMAAMLDRVDETVVRPAGREGGRRYTAPLPGEVAEWLKALAC